MAETTGISWADATFNPWVGCSKVSPACAHCYAEKMVTGRMGRANTWGEEGTRQRTSVANWRKPLAWNRESVEQGRVRFGGSPDERIRVFCASLADVFEPRPELEPWRRDLMALIASTPELDWLLLTKRPDLARDWLRDYYERTPFPAELFAPARWASRDGIEWGVLPNVWIGASVENARFTWRADALRQIPATVRFLSCEPLLGTLFPEPRPLGRSVPAGLPAADVASEGGAPTRERAPLDLTGIDWVIAGGESGGRDSRPSHPEWFRQLRDAVLAACSECGGDGFTVGHDSQCYEGDGCSCSGVQLQCDCVRPAFHFKQWGSWAPAGFVSGLGGREEGPLYATSVSDSGILNGTPWAVYYRGPSPKAGGKLLDGVDWCEIPDVSLVPA